MAERIFVDLVVDDGSRRMLFLSDRQAHFFDCGKTFRFFLHRKQVCMGSVRVDQFWMDTRGLYGDRRQKSQNRVAVIDYFWALCKKHLTVLHREIQQVFILAQILPFVRSNGSQRIFIDATLSRDKRLDAGKEPMCQELDSLLGQTSGQQLTEVEFRDRTADLLGPPDYCNEVVKSYVELLEEVLDVGCDTLERRGEAGLSVALDAWTRRMEMIGRRAGNQIQKQAMDILSYEARTAFHQCYSAVWLDLLKHLRTAYSLSEESMRFHQFWQLQLRNESEEMEHPDFYLFHGHIFGLHPACGNFMLTQWGPRLVGDWLSDPDCVSKYEEVLHGLYVSMFQYWGRYQNSTELRRRQPKSVGGAVDLDSVQVPRDTRRRSKRQLDVD